MVDCKSQILATIPDNKSCSRALVNAVVLTASQTFDDTLLINVSDDVKNKIIKILNTFYPNVQVNSWDDFLLLSADTTEPLTATTDITKHDNLTSLKSLFLTCGKLYYTDDNFKNSKGYSLEFVFREDAVAKLCVDLLNTFNFDLKSIKRRNNYVVYTKNSNIICDLLVTLGATHTALEIQNSLAMREIRNNANRQNNCFDSNLDKTLSASALQLEAINYIINNHTLDYLEENLREVALVRLANPDVSLSDLRILMNNTISRAGIKYRLDKIIDIYKKLKGE
ncbi:MAG: DNA-binding protein WhiA [Clostridia bacterium]|nr:DNA-binding protein WhiA [Clostridia bacterium]